MAWLERAAWTNSLTSLARMTTPGATSNGLFKRFTVGSVAGALLHAATVPVALAPHGYVLALEGIAIAVAWTAARRPAWRPESATRAFTGAALVFAVGAAVAGSAFVHATWDESRSKFQQVAAALDRAGAATSDRVMSIDAAGTKYWSGRGGVVLVNDPPDTVRAVIDAYDIRWLVLDREDSVTAAAPILDGTSRPTWLGEPVLADGDPIRLAVYPVEPGA